MAGIGTDPKTLAAQYQFQQFQMQDQMHAFRWQAVKSMPALPTPPAAPSFPADAPPPTDTGVSPYDQFLSNYQSSFKGWDAQTGNKGYLTHADVNGLLQDSPENPALRTLHSLQDQATNHDDAEVNFRPDQMDVLKNGGTAPPSPRSFTMPALQHVLGENYQDQQDYGAFHHRYQENFPGWDAMSGKKGYLTNEDIDTLMQNPHIKGDDAAALASIKTFADSEGDVHFNRNGAFAVTPPGMDAAFAPSGPPTNLFDSNSAALGKSYATQRTNLANSSHELFAHGEPDWRAVHQSDNGDCFLESTLTSMAKESPERVKNLIQEGKDGNYTVTFPGHEPVTVAKPTDAELAHYGGDGSDGTWSSVISKAYGAMRYREGNFTNSLPSGREPYDGADGGTEVAAIRDLTGHGSKLFETSPLGDTPASSIDDIRQGLIHGLQPGRIAAAGTQHLPSDRTPDGLPTGHSFTVLGYDAKSDTITLRNPWRNAPTDHMNAEIHQQQDGVLSMPLSRFMQNFQNLTIEDPSVPPPPLKPGVAAQ